MFEEINQHRAAVAEQIQKACEIGFTGGELEKAHKVGDIHPNGKWVWTQLPSGRYDWRVIKRTSGGSASAAPATAQKKEISVDDALEKFLTSREDADYNEALEQNLTKHIKDLENIAIQRAEKKGYKVKQDAKPISVSANHPAFSSVVGVDNVKEYLTTFNSKYNDLSKVTLSRTPKGNWDVRYDGHRLGILNGDQIPESSVKKMGWMEKAEAATDAKKLLAELK